MNPFVRVRTVAVRLLIVMAMLLALAGCGSGLGSSAASSAETNTPGQPPILPDPSLTPGATLPVTRDDICRPGYAKAVRSVPSDVKRQVYAEYGITHHARGEYEVDHLISLELGGSNSIKNLWPESYRTQPWNAHVKDQLEDRLHDMVCSGQIDLPAAQHEIATDWIAAYKKEFHTSVPLSQAQWHSRRHSRRHMASDQARAMDDQPDLDSGSASAAASAQTQTAGGNGQVWVNTRSGKYFRPGSKYYGHTKEGQYMSESDALAAGYVAAKSD